MLHCQFTRRMFFCIVMGCDVSLLSPALFISKFVYVSLSVHGNKLIDSVHKLQLFEERGQPDSIIFINLKTLHILTLVQTAYCCYRLFVFWYLMSMLTDCVLLELNYWLIQRKRLRVAM